MKDLLDRWGRPARRLAALAFIGSAAVMSGQSVLLGIQAQGIQTQPEVLNFDMLAQLGTGLVKQAKADNGSASITMANYDGHYTMLSARTQSGGGELHKHFADFLIVIDGEGTELTGGTMVDGKEGPNGEVRGTRLEGATPHVLHKGDFIHIPAGTPHQAIEAPGQTITTYVIKVEARGEGEVAKALAAPPPPPPPPAKK